MGAPSDQHDRQTQSTLAREADVNLDVSVARRPAHWTWRRLRAPPALVMGDALAIALLEARGFTPEDSPCRTPGGSLGRRLLLHVRHHAQGWAGGSRGRGRRTAARCTDGDDGQGLGMTAVVDPAGRAVGVFTDGDLRRCLDRRWTYARPVAEVMTRGGNTSPDRLAVEALNMMEDSKINALLVIDADGRLCGALNMHDLLRAGVV